MASRPCRCEGKYRGRREDKKRNTAIMMNTRKEAQSCDSVKARATGKGGRLGPSLPICYPIDAPERPCQDHPPPAFA